LYERFVAEVTNVPIKF